MKYIRFSILTSICILLTFSFCGDESGRNPAKETQILKLLLGSSHSVQNDSVTPETSESVISKSSDNLPAYDKKEDSPSIDCTDAKCSFPFRKDYREFLDLKYGHQREIHYYTDADGTYYLRFNPSARSSNRFDLKTRVTFKTLRAAGIRYSLLIDEENQSSSVVARTAKGKTVWTHLLSSVPTLSPMRSGNQIFVCTQDGKITSLNMHTGKQNWFFMTPGAVLIQPAAYHHFIIIFDDSGNIFWLDKNTGSLKHKYLLEEMPVISPVLKERILVLSTPRGYIHGIKAMEAFPAWKDHSLMGRIEALYDSDEGFVLEGSSIVLFHFQTGAKQKFLNEEEIRILAKKTPEFLRSPRMLRYAVEREKSSFSVSGL